jgi:GNAT superfamily N-acetyltransferase
MHLIMRPAVEADVPMLAALNKRLIEDEGSRNPMTMAELQQRMRAWLSGDWQVRLFEGENGGVVGYAVFQPRSDDYFPETKIVYLRQLYVEREQRSQGLGRQALWLLREREFPTEATVVIDVLATNPRGQCFWSKMGFESYCTTMHLKKVEKQAGQQEHDR